MRGREKGGREGEKEEGREEGNLRWHSSCYGAQL